MIFHRAKPISRVFSAYAPNTNIRVSGLGCGHGAFLYFLQKAGYQDVHGVDGSAEQVALAHRLRIPAVEQQEIGLDLATVKDETVMYCSTGCFRASTRRSCLICWMKCLKYSRPGAKCIAHVPNASGLYGMQIRYGDLTHEMAFTPRSAQQAFSTVGFHPIQCFEY